MTIDEAIRILDPKTTAEALAEIEYYGGFRGDEAMTKACDDACIIAVETMKRSRWIPVSERLPETRDEEVLVIASGQIGNIELIDAMKLGTFATDEGWILEMWPEWENPTVTHWMPLPEPPEEGGNDDGAEVD